MNNFLNIIANFQDNASPQLERLNGLLGEFGQGLLIGAAKAAAVGALLALTKNALDAGDAMDNMSQRTGTATDELSKIAYAAKLSDTSIEGVQMAFKHLAKSMVDSKDATSKAAQAFAEYGVQTKNADGSLRATNDVMEDLADVFKDMPDGAEKSALAMKLLGKNGQEMIPYLNSGKAALQEMKKEAEQFGVVWKPEQAKNAADFNDNLDRIGQVVKGLFTQIVQGLLPTMVTLTDAFISSAKEGGMLRFMIDAIGSAFRTLNVLLKPIYLGIYVITSAFTSLGKVLGGVTAAMVAFLSGDFKGASNIMASIGDDLAKTGQDLVKFNDELMNGKPAEVATTNNKKTKDGFKEVSKEIKEARAELDKYLAALNKESRDLSVGEKEKKLLELQDKAQELVKKGLPQKEIMAFIERGAKLINEIDAKKQEINLEERTKKIKEETEALIFENSLVEMSNDDRVIAIELRKLEKDMIGATKDEINLAVQARKHELEIQRDNKKLDDLLKETSDAKLESSRDNIKLLTEAYKAGRMSEQQYLEAVQISLEKTKEKSKEAATEMTEFWKEAARGIQGAFADFFFDYMQGKLTDLGEAIKHTIDRAIANMLAAQAVTALFGSNFGQGGSIGGLAGAAGSYLSGMFRAEGGPVSAGQPYIVGERRPELFVPNSDGFIRPDTSSLSGGAQVNVNITAMDSQDVMRVLSNKKREIAEMVNGTNMSYNLRGAR